MSTAVFFCALDHQQGGWVHKSEEIIWNAEYVSGKLDCTRQSNQLVDLPTLSTMTGLTAAILDICCDGGEVGQFNLNKTFSLVSSVTFPPIYVSLVSQHFITQYVSPSSASLDFRPHGLCNILFLSNYVLLVYMYLYIMKILY